MTSLFRQAVRAMLNETVVVCPHCGGQNIPGAKPTLEPEQNGTLTCTNCSVNFTPPPLEKD